MFARLYYTTALALLPSTEAVVDKFGKLVAKLDAQTQHLEGYLEEQAVALAKNAQSRRSIGDAVKAAVSHVIDAIEAAFDRREQAIIDDISSVRTKLEKASAARDAVSSFLENAGK